MLNTIDTIDIKRRLLENLRLTMGCVAEACRATCISRSTFYDYCKEDPAFKQAVEDIDEETLDFAEKKLRDHIAKDNVVANIFFLKTKAKRRGYVERQEITGNSGGPLNVTFNVSSEEEQGAVEEV